MARDVRGHAAGRCRCVGQSRPLPIPIGFVNDGAFPSESSCRDGGSGCWPCRVEIGREQKERRLKALAWCRVENGAHGVRMERERYPTRVLGKTCCAPVYPG